MVDTIVQLPTPTGGPASSVNQAIWSHNGKYLLVGAAVTPFARMFKRVGDTLTALANFTSGQPTAYVTQQDWGFNDNVFLCNWLNSSNYGNVYSNPNNDTFSLVTAGNGVSGQAYRYTPDGTMRWDCQDTVDLLRIFVSNPTTGALGAQYTKTWTGAAASAPSVGVKDAAITSDNKIVALGTARNGTTLQVYDITALNATSATITLSRRPTPTQLFNSNISSIKWHPNNRHLSANTGSTTAGEAGCHVFDVPATPGAAFTRIALLTGASATEQCRNAEWSADGTLLLVTFATNFRIYHFDASTGTFSTPTIFNLTPLSIQAVWGSMYQLDSTTCYIAIGAFSSTPTMTWYKLTVSAPNPDVNANVSIPMISPKASIVVNPPLNVRATIPMIKPQAIITSYVQDFPATQPYRLLSQVVVAPGDAEFTQAPYAGDPLLIDAVYANYGAAIDAHEYTSYTIGAVYSGYQALLRDQSEGIIDAVYAGYEAAIVLSNPAWTLTIDGTYASYEASLDGDWPFGTLIDAVYSEYGAAIDANIPYALDITAAYAGYQAFIDGDIPQGALITAQYPGYQALITGKTLHADTSIVAIYAEYGAALDATQIPAIRAVYPTYSAAIDGDVQSAFGITALYPTYSAAIRGQFPIAPRIAALYPVYGAALQARSAFMLDANVRYAGYQASLYMTVPTVPTSIDAMYPTYGAQIITHYYQPEYIDAVYPSYAADLVGDIGHPLEINIGAVYQGYVASLTLLLYEQIFIDAVYPTYGADIEVQYIPKRKRQIYLVQPV